MTASWFWPDVFTQWLACTSCSAYNLLNGGKKLHHYDLGGHVMLHGDEFAKWGSKNVSNMHWVAPTVSYLWLTRTELSRKVSEIGHSWSETIR